MSGENKLSSANFQSKKEFKLPEGATIVSSDYSMNVKEIENGFILRKEYSIKYLLKDGDDTQYDYITKEWFTKDNPIKIDVPKEKSLIDKLG